MQKEEIMKYFLINLKEIPYINWIFYNYNYKQMF